MSVVYNSIHHIKLGSGSEMGKLIHKLRSCKSSLDTS